MKINDFVIVNFFKIYLKSCGCSKSKEHVIHFEKFIGYRFRRGIRCSGVSQDQPAQRQHQKQFI